MGIAIIKSAKKTTGGLSGNVWNAVTLVAIVAVSIGVGFGVGWTVKPQHTITQQGTPTPATTIFTPPPPPTTTSPPPTPSPATTPAPSRPQSFLLMGDSLTEQGGWPGAWVDLLKQTYTTHVNVLNRGRTGFNTDQTLHSVLPSVLQELASSVPPVFITLWLGANDAALANGPNAAQHIEITQYKANLYAIISQLRDFAPLAKILLITPPVVDDAVRRQRLLDDGKPGDPLDRSNEQAGAYAAACREVASAVAATSDQVTLLDMYSYLMATYPEASARSALLGDGLHFNGQGNAVVFEQVKKQIEALLPASLEGA